MQQADSKLHCASAGNLIGAAGAQALLQAVHTSTGRLTTLDLSGEHAALRAAGSHALLGTGQPSGISRDMCQQTGALAACAELCSCRQTTHSACRAAWQQVPAKMLLVMHHVVCCTITHQKVYCTHPCMCHAAGNPCEQEAPAILQSIEHALQRNRSSAWSVPEAQGSPGPASGRSAVSSAAPLCVKAVGCRCFRNQGQPVASQLLCVQLLSAL